MKTEKSARRSMILKIVVACCALTFCRSVCSAEISELPEPGAIKSKNSQKSSPEALPNTTETDHSNWHPQSPCRPEVLPNYQWILHWRKPPHSPCRPEALPNTTETDHRNWHPHSPCRPEALPNTTETDHQGTVCKILSVSPIRRTGKPALSVEMFERTDDRTKHTEDVILFSGDVSDEIPKTFDTTPRDPAGFVPVQSSAKFHRRFELPPELVGRAEGSSKVSDEPSRSFELPQDFRSDAAPEKTPQKIEILPELPQIDGLGPSERLLGAEEERVVSPPESSEGDVSDEIPKPFDATPQDPAGFVPEQSSAKFHRRFELPSELVGRAEGSSKVSDEPLRSFELPPGPSEGMFESEAAPIDLPSSPVTLDSDRPANGTYPMPRGVYRSGPDISLFREQGYPNEVYLEEAHRKSWPQKVLERSKISLLPIRLLFPRKSKPQVLQTDFPYPRELEQVSQKPHLIKAPDVLLIEVHKTPILPDAPLEPLEVLIVQATGTIPIKAGDDDIEKQFKRVNGLYQIQSNGTINFGPEYGSVYVAGLSVSEARTKIEEKLLEVVFVPKVVVARETLSRPPISGTSRVQQDGTVSLGVYGRVLVKFVTLSEAAARIAEHLSEHILDPKVTVELVSSLNKFYYIILDGGGFGEQVIRLPLIGWETVLDAISTIGGLPPNANKKKIRIVRPGHSRAGGGYVLPIDWNSIVYCGLTDTNYQIFPGDRIYITSDLFIASDNIISKVTAPFIRVLGITSLTHDFFQQMKGAGGGGGGLGSGIGGGSLFGIFSRGSAGFGGGGLGAGFNLAPPGIYGGQGSSQFGGGRRIGAGFGPGGYVPSYAPVAAPTSGP